LLKSIFKVYICNTLKEVSHFDVNRGLLSGLNHPPWRINCRTGNSVPGVRKPDRLHE